MGEWAIVPVARFAFFSSGSMVNDVKSQLTTLQQQALASVAPTGSKGSETFGILS
jgi:hypothetical protein